MLLAGYFAKRIKVGEYSPQAPQVREICSVSECISPGPEGWFGEWRHNGVAFFNSPADILDLIPIEERAAYRVFAYRLHPEFFHEGQRVPFSLPEDVRPIELPAGTQSLGFDSMSNGGEELIVGWACSPLSCNYYAHQMPTNEHCLFPTLEAALAGAEVFDREQPEPGDYYVAEVLELQSCPPA